MTPLVILVGLALLVAIVLWFDNAQGGLTGNGVFKSLELRPWVVDPAHAPLYPSNYLYYPLVGALCRGLDALGVFAGDPRRQLTIINALSGALSLGIVYLLWLAWKLSRSATLGQADSASLNVGFKQGVLLQFLNIKAWLLALTLVAGWIAGQPDALQRFAIVAPVMLLYAFTSNFAYAVAGALLRRWLAQGRRLLWFNRAMGAILVLTAWWMLSV